MEREGSQAAPPRQPPQADDQLTKQLTADVSHVLRIICMVLPVYAWYYQCMHTSLNCVIVSASVMKAVSLRSMNRSFLAITVCSLVLSSHQHAV